jgi:hypothetical protein
VLEGDNDAAKRLLDWIGSTAAVIVVAVRRATQQEAKC